MVIGLAPASMEDVLVSRLVSVCATRYNVSNKYLTSHWPTDMYTQTARQSHTYTCVTVLSLATAQLYHSCSLCTHHKYPKFLC